MQSDPRGRVPDERPWPVAVVGGGITGLALRHYLERRGVRCVVLEATSEPGGVIRSVRRNDSLLDLGPQRTRLVPIVSDLTSQLDLGSELMLAPADLPLFIYRGGRLREVPRDARSFLSTDLLSWRGKLRLLLEPATAPPLPGESVAECLGRKLGEEAYRHLAGPLYGGVHGSDPAEMEVRHSLGPTLERMGVSRSILLGLLSGLGGGSPPRACTFRSGMQALPLALRRAAGDRVRLDAPVRRMDRPEDGPWILEAGTETVRAGQVVVTAPADRAAALLSDVAQDAASRLSRLRYRRIAVVHLSARCELRGMGYQASLDSPLITRGVTWNDSLFDRPGVYTAYLRPGGRSSPELAAVAAEEFEHVTGCRARPLHVSTVRVPSRDGSWEALRGLRLPSDLHLCAAYDGRPGIPGRLEAARELAERIAGPPSSRR